MVPIEQGPSSVEDSHRPVIPGKFSPLASIAPAMLSPPAKMAEATPSTKPPRKARKKTASSPALPADAGLLSAWRLWGGAGLILVGSVVAWRLLGVSYRADVETICNGEKGSGYTAQKDMAKVTQWVRDHLGTPEGNRFYSALNDSKMHERARTLQSTASEVKVAPCPMVASFEQVAADGDYRTDLQHLCSRLTFPKLDESDDDERLSRLLEWIDQKAISPRTKELTDPLEQAASPADRAKLLSDAGLKMDVFSCETSKTLNLPQQPAKAKGPPAVRPYAAPQIIGTMPEADFAKGLAEATPAMNQCYVAGLAKKPELEGRLSVKLQIDPGGKVINAGVADSKVPDRDTERCIVQALREMHAPKNAGPLVSVLVPLELTTAMSTTAGSPHSGGTLTAPEELPASAPSASSPAPAAAH